MTILRKADHFKLLYVDNELIFRFHIREEVKRAKTLAGNAKLYFLK